jgi:hypothetical protein
MYYICMSICLYVYVCTHIYKYKEFLKETASAVAAIAASSGTYIYIYSFMSYV